MSFRPESGGYIPPSEREPSPESERVIDASLEKLCEGHLVKFNEGSNAIVAKTDTESMTPELRDALTHAGIDLGDERVAKILKVYGDGRGRAEFEMQKRAYDLVEAQPDKERYARIPRPIMYRDFPVSEEAKDRISRMTGKAYLDGRAELLMMDLVDGDDVATMLYKEVARRHPKTADIAEHLDGLEFHELQERVFSALGFAIPGGKSRDASEREMEARKVFSANADKLTTFLRHKSFTLDPQIPQQIENTMRLLHDAGIAFRDGHHRNFMISGDQAFIIDFGAATDIGERTLDEVFREELPGEGNAVASYVDDFYVASELRKFTDRNDARDAAQFFAKRRSALARNPRFAQEFAAVAAKAGAGTLNLEAELRAAAGVGMPNEGKVDLFLAALSALAEAQPERADELRAFAKREAAEAKHPWMRKKFSYFLLSLE